MEILSNSWFSEMAMDDPMIFTDQCDIMDSFDVELAAALGEDFHNSFSSDLSSSSSNLNGFSTTLSASNSSIELASQNKIGINERPSKKIMPNNCTIGNVENCSSAPIILSFGNANWQENHQLESVNAEEETLSDVVLVPSLVNIEEYPKGTKRSSGGRARAPSQTYDHIIAERKRRELLSQRFMILSAIVPGLKKRWG